MGILYATLNDVGRRDGTLVGFAPFHAPFASPFASPFVAPFLPAFFTSDFSEERGIRAEFVLQTPMSRRDLVR